MRADTPTSCFLFAAISAARVLRYCFRLSIVSVSMFSHSTVSLVTARCKTPASSYSQSSRLDLLPGCSRKLPMYFSARPNSCSEKSRYLTNGGNFSSGRSIFPRWGFARCLFFQEIRLKIVSKSTECFLFALIVFYPVNRVNDRAYGLKHLLQHSHERCR